MTLDLSRLGAWAELGFFTRELPAIEEKLEAASTPVYPPPDSVFRALELTQPEETRVIILGQDPYHTLGKADGLAFSIPQDFGGRLDSLGNIFKELKSDLDVDRKATDLTDWAQQGVLLLNTSLTVPEGKAGGHKTLGWSKLVAEVLARLDAPPRAVVLWGRPAQKVGAQLTHAHHLRIESPHPSPLSAARGFFGSRPFSQVNSWLSARGEPAISWG